MIGKKTIIGVGLILIGLYVMNSLNLQVLIVKYLIPNNSWGVSQITMVLGFIIIFVGITKLY